MDFLNSVGCKIRCTRTYLVELRCQRNQCGSLAFFRALAFLILIGLLLGGFHTAIADQQDTLLSDQSAQQDTLLPDNNIPSSSTPDGSINRSANVSLPPVSTDPLLDDFEGVLPSFQVARGGALSRLQNHARTDQGPFAGRRCEVISAIGMRGGERILATRDIPPVAVIEELKISAQVRGNRPGFQLMARVRLPRTKTEDGQPIAIYLLGDRYQKTANWQELTISNVSGLVANQVRAMRVQAGFVDANEAYVDQVAINVYGGPLLNKVWIDNLSVTAGVRVSPESITSRQGQSAVVLANYDDAELREAHPSESASRAVLRIARYHGGPLAQFHRQGFNTVWLADSTDGELAGAGPTPALLKEARRLQLKLICPPVSGNPPPSLLESLIAWDLTEANAPQGWDPSEFHARNGQFRPIISREDVPWADIRLVNQVESRNSRKAYWLDTSTASRWLPMRDQARSAVFAGYSGFVAEPFSTDASEGSRYTVQLSKLLNLELTMLEPLIRQQKSLQPVRPRRAEEYRVVGLEGRHSSLIWIQSRQSELRQRRSRQSNVDLTNARYQDAFIMEPGNLELAEDRRIAGGMRLLWPTSKPDGLVLLTDQPEIQHAWKSHLNTIGSSYCEALTHVIRYELLQLDRELNGSQIDKGLANHIRRELHALHGRIAPLMETGQTPPTYRQLNHLHAQLDRVYRVCIPDVTSGGARPSIGN